MSNGIGLELFVPEDKILGVSRPDSEKFPYK